MRKSYGTTWWGQQWLQSLNRIDYSNRLPRGRSYANKGAVETIEIEGNQVNASVSGSRPWPYRVEISVPLFVAETKGKIMDLVTENPVFLSNLLNRRLPAGLHQACLEQDINLFPRSWSDLKGACSCPDWAVPCKHMAAVLYLVANEIDKNPFLVFELHGFDLFQELAGMQYAAEEDRESPIRTVESLRTSFLQLPIPEPFQWDAETFQNLDFSQLPDCREQLLTLLPEQALFYPVGDFRATLNKAYVNVAKSLGRLLRTTEPERTRMMDAVDTVQITLDRSMGFLKCGFRDYEGKTLLTHDNVAALSDWLDEVPLPQVDKLAPALCGLKLVHHLAERLALHSAFQAQLLRVDEERYRIRWLPATLNEEVRSVCEQVARLCPPGLIFYNTGQEIEVPAPEEHFPTLLSLFLGHYVSRFSEVKFRLEFDKVVSMFFCREAESFQAFEELEYPNAIQLWLRRLYLVEKDFVPVLQVDDLGPAFSVEIAIEDRTELKQAPIPLNDILEKDEYGPIRLDVLRDISMLAEYFPQCEQLLATRGKDKLLFNPDDFVDILFKIIPTLRLFGIQVLLPKALRRLIRPQVSMQLEAQDNGSVTSSGIISLENMLRFQWQVALGGQLISPEDFLGYVQQFSGIVKLNDQYVYFNEKEIRALVDKLDKPPHVSGHQLLQVALTESYQGAGVKLDANAQKLLRDLLSIDEIPPPAGMLATLRPYQERGYAWLYKNARLGLGSLIADDMGLGKTLQVICALLRMKADGSLDKPKGLIIVPTTLLTNWLKEIDKFAPGLHAHLYHGPGRDIKGLEEADLLLTTYGVVRSENARLAKMPWLCVVIDEAQNIKNPAAAQTKAVKRIKAPVRIAMSGTPVENRLSEYWSQFDFINPGYLGNLKNFKETFARPIELERDQKQLVRFRRLTEPFIMRRLKTDRSIIRDLPDKIEKDQFCTLTPDQAALYQSVVHQNLEAVREADGIQRQGLVLKLMTALKQVCNHPRHFLKKGKPDPALSGKSLVMLDLLRQILDQDEKALLFTQYREMGELLVKMIQSEFGFAPPFLHGGVRRKGRDAMVEDFQENRNTRILLLSLKAGGTGLNLTAASNVIHYDLWWNPAVETQATDRAYRIGQTRNVLVHRFITQGTFEEKINLLLQRKKELADLTVNSGEKWIGELSNAELKELVVLEG